MKDSFKKVLAVLVILAIVVGWYITIWGIPGLSKPIKDKIPMGLDIKGGVYVVLEAQGTDKMSKKDLKDLMDRTQAVIEKRVDAMGLANPNVSIEGENRIRIELPGAKDAEAAIRQIGKTAQLKFVFADQKLILDGSSVEKASVGQNNQKRGYVVNLEFDAKGSKAFEDATRITAAGGVPATITEKNGQPVANDSIVIVLDNEIISAPTAKDVISGGKCEISGHFTQKEATTLSALIRGGALPVELKEITSSAQTAKIGMDALNMSIFAGIIGICIIFLIMLVGYRLLGLAANIALALYVILILLIMSIMGSVLTLPGIAGIILSVGMAVDANVVIFSRIKEEIVGGKSIRVATSTGFKRAMSTIIDSQITTLIAAVILYQIGTSTVKGFAWTLMIGIVVSIFTAVIITQLYLNIFSESKVFGKNKFFGIREDGTASFQIKKRFSIIKYRKIYYIVSIILIVGGLAVGGIRGFSYGIDFTGGTMLHIDMGKQVSSEKIKEVMKNHKINVSQMELVYAGKGNKEVIIKTNESLSGNERESITNDMKSTFGLKKESVLASEHFGASVGKELKHNALKAVLLAAIGMFIYIRLRFRQWKFGGAALLGVLHDVLIVIAFYAIFRVTVNNPFIAAILTVVGYSINDTIVIFDRIRENLRFMRRGGLEELVDTSINQTLSRSIMTSMTTVVVMIPLYMLAGSSIREFVLPLIIGVAVGCLSSVFVCSPLYYEFSKGGRASKYQKQSALAKKKANRELPLAKGEKKEENLDGDKCEDFLKKDNEKQVPAKGHKKKSKAARKKH